MARSTVFDAFEKFRFSVSWSDATSAGSETTSLTRAGFHDIDLPKRSTTIGEYREGLDADFPQLFQGLTRIGDVAMHRGATDSLDFYKWALSAHNSEKKKGTTALEAGGNSSLAAGDVQPRKDLTVELKDRSGATVKAWKLVNCLVVSFAPGDKLDSMEDSAKLMEELVVRPEDMLELRVDNGVVSTSGAAE